MIISPKFRLAWLLSILLLAGFLTNSVSNYLASKANIRETITYSSLPLTSDNIYSEIQRDLLQPVFISSLMANDTFLKDWALEGEKNEQQITKYLNEIKIRYSTVSSFFVSEKTRKYYHAHGLLKTIDENDPRDAWYFRARDLEAAYEINVDADQANQDEMTIFINYQVRGYDGNFLGIAGVGLTVNRVNLLISSYEAKFDRHILFTDPEGKIVLRPSNSIFDGISNISEIDGLQPHVDDLLNGERTRVTFVSNHQTSMLNSRYVPELHWYLHVQQSEESMLQPFRKQLFINISIALFITFVVAWLSIRYIIRYNNNLEAQNAELSKINQQIEAQRLEITKTASELEISNKALSERNHEKDEFISIVAHDLRNPLNGILGLCELTEAKDERQREFIEDIQTSSESMMSLINTLLEVSRIEGHSGPMKSEVISVNEILKSSLRPFEKQAAHKHITIQTELNTSDDVNIETQPDWLEICLSNLLSNAIKYTPPFGKVVLKSTSLDDCTQVCVSDSGPGISQEDQQKLYGKFVRLSAKPTGGESSTGLGLYVVKNMCDRLGISISLKSALGTGSTFCIKIPEKCGGKSQINA